MQLVFFSRVLRNEDKWVRKVRAMRTYEPRLRSFPELMHSFISTHYGTLAGCYDSFGPLSLCGWSPEGDRGRSLYAHRVSPPHPTSCFPNIRNIFNLVQASSRWKQLRSTVSCCHLSYFQTVTTLRTTCYIIYIHLVMFLIKNYKAKNV